MDTVPITVDSGGIRAQSLGGGGDHPAEERTFQAASGAFGLRWVREVK